MQTPSAFFISPHRATGHVIYICSCGLACHKQCVPVVVFYLFIYVFALMTWWIMKICVVYLHQKTSKCKTFHFSMKSHLWMLFLLNLITSCLYMKIRSHHRRLWQTETSSALLHTHPYTLSTHQS